MSDTRPIAALLAVALNTTKPRTTPPQNDVINPQDGHILCDLKPGLSIIKRADALKVLNERVTTLGSVRRRAQNGGKTGSMNEPSFFYRLRRGPSRKVGTPKERRRDA